MTIQAQILLTIVTLLFGAAFPATGETESRKITAETQRRAAAWNRTHVPNVLPNWSAVRPFSEIEETGFVVTNSTDQYEMHDLRVAIARSLPEGVTLVLYVKDPSDVYDLQRRYGSFLSADRLKFVKVSGYGDSVWARDSLPFPVYSNGGSAKLFGLVASIYPQQFDPNTEISTALSLPMVHTGQYFRGGNLLFDLEGNCFAENAAEAASLSDAEGFFKNFFGCKTVTLLEKEGGIGDIDERVKFLDGTRALTDSSNYARILTSRGYSVTMIPSTGVDGETYMNTLYVNGTIFVPQMGLSQDALAVKAYEHLGMKAVGVYTKTMADRGLGNIHCVTMNYPKGTFTSNLQNSAFVEFAVH